MWPLGEKDRGCPVLYAASPKGPSAGQLLGHIHGISERTFKNGCKKPGRERLENKKEQETAEVSLRLEEQKVLLGEADIQNIHIGEGLS